jgi:hypothetical protein
MAVNREDLPEEYREIWDELLMPVDTNIKIKDVILKGIRKCYCKFNHIVFLPENYELNRQVANDWIYELLSSDKPCMIS